MNEKPSYTPQRVGDEDLITDNNWCWCFTSHHGLPVGRWLNPFEVYTYMFCEGDEVLAKRRVTQQYFLASEN